MPYLNWSARALRDLTRIQAFLQPKSPDASQRAAVAIRQGLKTLQQYPSVGRLVDGLGLDYRDMYINFGDSGYLVRYRIEKQGVVILGIKHAREAGY